MKKIILILFLLFCFNVCYSTNCDMTIKVYAYGHCNTTLADAYVEVYISGGSLVCSGNTSGGILVCSNLAEGSYDIFATGLGCCDAAVEYGHNHSCSSVVDIVNLCLNGVCACGPIHIEGGNNASTIESYRLLQNYPNPFNPMTVIQYDIPSESNVSLRIYDIAGREIQTLVNETKAAGSYQVSFNAEALPSGIYFYILRAGGFADTKKMVLMK